MNTCGWCLEASGWCERTGGTNPCEGQGEYDLMLADLHAAPIVVVTVPRPGRGAVTAPPHRPTP